MTQINCNEHGKQNFVFVCQHLLHNIINKVYYVPAEGDDESQIWCETCENARIDDKGWNDIADNIADWKIICTTCADEKIKKANEIITY